MSRGITVIRAGAVWLLTSAVTAGAVRAAAVAVRDTAATGGSGADAATADLVAACAVVLAVALVRIWLVTTVTVVGVVAGSARARRGHPGTTRRLVLLACGVAVTAGVAAPATAAGDEGRDVVAGLALPERAVAAPPTSTPPSTPATTPSSAPAPTDTYVVRPGDSLWSIALAHPATGADTGTDTDARWRALWHANRAVVGDDPDLIHPGQALRLPAASPDRTQQDGDRG